MAREFIHTKEGEEIIALVDKLTPWEQKELLSHLANRLSADEFYETFIEGSEYDDDDDDWDDEEDISYD